MKRSALGLVACIAWIAFFGCASEGEHPPQLGSCGSADASCPPAIAGGGIGGGGLDSGTGSCMAMPGQSQCGLCEMAQCCSVLESCLLRNPPCAGLLNCENACAGAANCASDCLGRWLEGAAGLNAVTSCALAKCPVCSQLGVGDPCSSGTCNPSLSCHDDLWCSKPCIHSSDCDGLGASGTNARGLANGCLPAGICYAGCATSDDCRGIPGTFCNTVMSIEQLPVTVCQSMQDAAVTD